MVNPGKMTRVGNPVGYKVVPAGTAASLLDPNDPPQLRGAFTNNQVITYITTVAVVWFISVVVIKMTFFWHIRLLCYLFC